MGMRSGGISRVVISAGHDRAHLFKKYFLKKKLLENFDHGFYGKWRSGGRAVWGEGWRFPVLLTPASRALTSRSDLSTCKRNVKNTFKPSIRTPAGRCPVALPPAHPVEVLITRIRATGRGAGSLQCYCMRAEPLSVAPKRLWLQMLSLGTLMTVSEHLLLHLHLPGETGRRHEGKNE